MGLKPLAQDLFERFPHGVLVFDRHGGLLAANRAASDFLGPLRRMPDGRPPRCCDLFGCKTPGVLREACLAELVPDAPGPLPDMRLDLGPSARAAAVWLTAAPLGGTPRHFLAEVRAADSRDRRRRTQPHWMGTSRLRVFALGRTRLESREGPIEGRWLEQRAGQLLKFLICERRRVVYPEEIAAAIWPHEQAQATGTVRYFIHRLRRHLEPTPPEHGPSSFVMATEGGYKLSPSVDIDAGSFESHVAAGLKAASDANDEEALEELERGMALYGGDLIADQPHAAWAFEERERLRTLAEQALHELLRIDLDRQDFDSALGRLRRMVQLQPLDVELHRRLLTLCLAYGRRSEAVRRYMVLRTRLRSELNEELDFELADLTPELSLEGSAGPESLPSARAGV